MANEANTFRGSRKHVLDLMSSSKFRSTMDGLLLTIGAQISQPCHNQPYGCQSEAARKEVSIETFLASHDQWRIGERPLRTWWIKHGGKRSTWDLLCLLNWQNAAALLIVEAKAYRGELSRSGKRLENKASNKKRDNHESIEKCIKTANEGFSKVGHGEFGLSIARKYQLANRLSYVWKLANLGVPVILMYLGFTGDESFKKGYFQSRDDWRSVMTNYLDGVVPKDFVEQIHSPNGMARFSFLVRSLDIIEKSPQPS
jgi:hypothetical protein